MGKASKWFRGLFGLKKSDPNPNPAQKPPAKKKWSFAKAHKERDHPKPQHEAAPSGFDDGVDASRHAIAVAAAPARPQAAAAVVKLTSTAGGNPSRRGAAAEGPTPRRALVKMAAGYGEPGGGGRPLRFNLIFARRALRALKALVKLQALAKGYICRKQFTEYLQQMHAIARVQERARSPETPEKFEHTSKSTKHQHLMTIKRNVLKSNGNLIHDQESTHSTRTRWMGRRTIEKSCEQGSFTRIVPMDDDKILEVDPGKPTPKYRNMFHSSHLSLSDQYYCQSFSNNSGEVQSFVEESNYFCTAENSPLYYSALSSRRGPLTPTKSDGSKSYVSGFYLDHPSYMAYTESSKAKVRSVSAPKQRPVHQYERSGSSTNRYSVHGFGGNNNESRVNNKVTAMHASFTSKAYPGSGRLDRLGMPVRDVSGFSGGHNWQRY
ncbi:hypothetical protein PHJA_000660600 [Phtheirospermum japonicum]|uniref:DUF4005 domain-containing protein n=1 Tax=Phtheirospermum japonicum TaxID=374723 RepID=A0A830BJ94_9LAMI|nr:hypothetical protein PHJA_000660600 [Phtheirospermum japonicum]